MSEKRVNVEADQTASPRQWARLVVVYLLIPVILFICGGELGWWQAWLYSVLILAAGIGGRMWAENRHPGLTAERQNIENIQNAKAWDKVLAPLMAVSIGFPMVIVAGLDHRHGWSSEFPLWLVVIGFILILLGYAFAAWAVAENRFFSSVVRIQTDRGHVVCDSGPYRLVRHPGYAGNVLALFGIVLALGSMMRSRWARRGEGMPVRIVHSVLFALLSLLLGFATGPVMAAEPGIAPATVTIGVLAHRGEAFALRQWRDTLDHLQAHLPNHTFRLAPFSLPDLEQAVKVHAVDFVLTNPGHTVYLSRYYGISQFASVQAPGSRDPSRSLGSVVFTRADRDDIEELGDLKGKRVLAVSRHAFGGYLIGWQAIAEALGRRVSTVKVEERGFPQDAIVTAVLAGEGDAGITRTCLLEHLIRAGRIAPGAVRVLSPRQEPRFNCQVSTDLYPGWAFSAHPATSAALTTEVARALYAMPSPANAMEFDYDGWIAPVSYAAVERLYRELDSEAFVPDLSAVIRLVVREHLEWLLFAALVLVLFLIHVGRVEWLVHQRTRQLRLEEAARSEFTERIRELEAETARAYRTSAMAEMAGGLAHELNQPISAILNYAHALSGLVAREQGDPELIEQTLAKIRVQGERAAGVVRGIFGFLRNRPPQLVATDLRGLVEQALAFSELNAAKYGCRLNWNRPVGAVVAQVDEIQFQQVLIILAQNAMEASAGLPEQRRTIDIALERMENRCLLTVTDRGEGLDQETTQRAFDPFFTTKSGLGLGLSVAATIVQRHHGELSLDSVQGEGTTATVQLPIAKRHAEKGPRP